MLSDTLADPLLPPCDIWRHFPVTPPLSGVSSTMYFLNGPLSQQLFMCHFKFDLTNSCVKIEQAQHKEIDS